MRKIFLISFFLVFLGFWAFVGAEEQEEVDFLLFLPDSSNQFANESLAVSQLDNLANYLKGRNLASGQIYVYGYAAFAINDVEPVALSRDRAFFVINELQRRGIARDLFAEPVGYGSVDLWGNNIDEMNRSLNRRVRILVDGSFLTAEIIEPEPEIETTIVEEVEIETVILDEEKISDKKEFKFPWILLLIPLIPLIYFLLRRRKKTGDKTPEKKIEPVAAPPKPEPVIVAPVVAPVPEPAHEPTPAPAVIVPEPQPIAASAPEPSAVAAASPTRGENYVYLEEEIRIRAYEIYQSFGQIEDAERDWYIALPEVCARYEAKGYRTFKEDGCWWAHKDYVKSNG